MFPRADLHASFTDGECGSLDYTGAFRSNLYGRTLAEALAARGYEPGEDPAFMRAEGARRSEQDWARRVHQGLRFTFAPRGRCDALPRPFIPPGVSRANAGGHTAAY